jgi:hypothetical protein
MELFDEEFVPGTKSTAAEFLSHNAGREDSANILRWILHRLFGYAHSLAFGLCKRSLLCSH